MLSGLLCCLGVDLQAFSATLSDGAACMERRIPCSGMLPKADCFCLQCHVGASQA